MHTDLRGLTFLIFTGLGALVGVLFSSIMAAMVLLTGTPVEYIALPLAVFVFVGSVAGIIAELK